MHEAVHWHWEEHHEKSFENLKKLLSSDRCLAFFDVSKSIAIQVDAYNSGLETVLFQEGKIVVCA